MQTKKRIRRRHDARISRTAIRMTNRISPRSRRPSLSASRSCAMPARFGSCVASTSVVPRRSFTSRSRSMMCRPFAESRFPVGSSASRMSGIVGERAGNRDALLLAARQLRRVVMPAAGQADFLEQRRRAGTRVRPARNFHRHHHVLERGQRRHQVEELEDEADLLPAQPGQPVLVERRDVGAVDHDPPGRRRVEAGNQAEQRRLPAAGRSGHREEPARGHVEIDRLEDGQRRRAAHHRFGHAAQFNHRDAACDHRFEDAPHVVGDEREPPPPSGESRRSD